MISNIHSLVRPSVLALAPYASARDDFKGVAEVYLDANESPFGSLNRYPDPHQSRLKQRLSGLKGIPPSHIFVGNGSDEVIDLVLRVFCRPGADRIIVCPPTYGMYRVSAAINEVDVVEVPLSTDFQLDLPAIQQFASDPLAKVVFVCSPNNPTGNTMAVADVQALADSFEGIVVVDEAYIDFAEQASLISLVQMYRNLIVMQTFSKAWASAGARVGTAYASPDIIDLLTKVKPPYNVSTISQEAICEVLDSQDVPLQIASIIEERERLALALTQVACVRKVYPSDANFLLVEVDDADTTYDYLAEQGVVVRNRSRQIDNCLRITVGNRAETQRLITTLNSLP